MRLFGLPICEIWPDFYLTVRPLVFKWTSASFGSAERHRTGAPIIAELVHDCNYCNQIFPENDGIQWKKANDIFRITLNWANLLSSSAMPSKYKPHIYDHGQRDWPAA